MRDNPRAPKIKCVDRWPNVCVHFGSSEEIRSLDGVWHVRDFAVCRRCQTACNCTHIELYCNSWLRSHIVSSTLLLYNKLADNRKRIFLNANHCILIIFYNISLFIDSNHIAVCSCQYISICGGNNLAPNNPMHKKSFWAEVEFVSQSLERDDDVEIAYLLNM